MVNSRLLTLFLLLFSHVLFAQSSIKKDIQRKKKKLVVSTSAALLTDIADQYRLIRMYDSAYVYYQRSALLNKTEGAVLKSSRCLLALDRKEEAIRLLKAELTLGPKIEAELDFIQKPQQWKTGELNLVNAVSTDQNEFPGSINEGEVIITTDALSQSGTTNKDPYTGNSPYTLYRSYLQIKDGQWVFSKLNPLRMKDSGKDFGKGAATYHTKKGELYYTRIISSGFKQVSGIFVQGKKGRSKAFVFNQSEYNLLHPTLNKEGTVLVFSSDKPGGSGKFDLYACRLKEDGQWSEPVNLGPSVNSEENEVFPSFQHNGTLYFSSDGWPGYGGLDLYRIKDLFSEKERIQHLGEPLNSISDDFAIIFKDELQEGLMASNRAHKTFRGDNIYHFRINLFSSMRGRLASSLSAESGSLSGIKVVLINSKGERSGEAFTDSQGLFEFSGISPDEYYMLQLEGQEAALPGRIYLFSDQNIPVAKSFINEKGDIHTFKGLTPDLSHLQELDLQEDTTLFHWSAYLMKEKNGKKIPAIKKKIYITDASGSILATAITNVFGAFLFTELNEMSAYHIYVEETDPELNARSRYFLTGKDGQVISSNQSIKDNKVFFYLPIQQIKKEDIQSAKPLIRKNLRAILKGIDQFDNPAILGGVAISLLDESGNKIRMAITKENGLFEFFNLNYDSAYYFALDEQDQRLSQYKRFQVADSSGKKVFSFVRDKLKPFGFRIFKSDEQQLAEIFIDDPWLNVLNASGKTASQNLIISENILYKTNSADISDEAITVLEKVILVLSQNKQVKVEVGAHTDSRATEEYNLKLSQKRAQTVVSYLIKRGVDAKRLIAKGYGESRIKNQCKDGVNCSEEEHALNRRTEFVIY